MTRGDQQEDSAHSRHCLSVHLYFNAPTIYGQEADSVILNVIAPAIECCRAQNWIRSFFFVRYWEEAPHIRLRMFGADACMQPLVESTIVERSGIAHTASTHGSMQSHSRGTSRGPASAKVVERLSWVSYEPETDRYGGPEALLVAHRVFAASSDAAVTLLKATRSDRARRLGNGLLAMLVLLKTLLAGNQDVAAFALHFRHAYLPALSSRSDTQETAWLHVFDDGVGRQTEALATYVGDALRRLDSRESLTEPLDRYREAMETCREQLCSLQSQRRALDMGRPFASSSECISRLLPSYLHMMNNRLGLTIADEAYLAHVLHRMLDRFGTTIGC
ncbi:MAG: thiopeptide-type bacteriocin biosynthesis protein [Gemmatimonadaceae bacterium]